LSSAFAESGAFFATHWKLILTIAYLAWAFAVVVGLILARRSSAGGSRDVQTLLATYGCTGCHAVDRKMVGPSFREVAHRFGSETGGDARVARRIREGGAGDWGAIPMPPHPAINDAELRSRVTWVFAQR
jgi:cytochrome c